MKQARLLLAFLTLALPANAALHYRQIDPHLYTGHQPHPEDYAALKRMGINTILDLRGGWIHAPHERKEVEAAGMHYVSVRLSGLWEPHDSQIAEILHILQDPADVPVFVHCRRGDDRTGLVVACYRIAHDRWTNQRALAEARRDHLNILEVLMQRYIRNFDPARVEAARAR